jgi:UDP-glucose 4-epimerase
VAEHAIEHGHDVIIFDRQGRQPYSSLDAAETRGRLSVFLGDVRDEVAMDELAAHCDGLIHLAACLGTQETINNPRPAAKTNHDGGLNFIEACRSRKRPGVYISVGNHWMNNTYAISKSNIERYVAMANVEWGTSINIVRPVNAYGPRQSVAPPYGPATVRKITPAFVCRALLGEPIEVYGDGQQVSDMVHVRDVARTLVTALEYAGGKPPLREPVEVGPSKSMSVNRVAHSVRQAVFDMFSIRQPSIKYLPMRPGEIPHSQVVANWRSLLNIGIDPESLIPFGLGIEETVKWYAEHWYPKYQAGRVVDRATMDDTVSLKAVV